MFYYTPKGSPHETKGTPHHTKAPPLAFYIYTIETMENLTAQQWDEVLKIFGEIYENAQRHKTCRQLSY